MCLYSSYESIVSRHYTSSISMCKKIGELSGIEDILPNSTVLFRAPDEFLVTDIEAVRAIFSKLNVSDQELDSYLKEGYLYLVIRKEK